MITIKDVKCLKKLIIASLGLSLWGSTASADDTLDIYTTIYPLQFLVEEIGGETVNVESIIPVGADAHSYEPTMQDMTKYANADAFLYVGGNMETFSTSIANALSEQSVQLIHLYTHEELFVSEHEYTHEHDDESHDHDDEGHDHDHEEGLDPHIWISPTKMMDVAEIIKDELIELNPGAESLYLENYEALIEDLETLDQDFHDTLKDKENAHIIVPHAAYGYWEEYGVTQIPLSGFSMSEEPSQRQLQELIATAEEYDLDFVLFEQNVESRIPEVIQKEIGAEARTIHNLEVRVEEEVENDDDYLDIMYRNLEVLDEVTK